MEHLTLKATTTDVDQELGTFTALVSGWTEDREGDTILPTAFDKTREALRASGKNLPLLFEHSARAIGSIDPASMQTTDEGLIVSGEVDRSTDAGKQVWSQIKANTAGFSIGYMSRSEERKDGSGREIYEIDLLEISATSTPMHPSTRVVSWKSAAVDEDYERWKAECLALAASVPRPPGEEELEQLRSESMRLVREILPAPVKAAEEESSGALPVMQSVKLVPSSTGSGAWVEDTSESVGDDGWICARPPSPEQAQERQKRIQREREEDEERDRRARDEWAAIEAAHREYEESAEISVAGVRVRPGDITFHRE